MKSLNQIIDEMQDCRKKDGSWKDIPKTSGYAPFRGMTQADFDGVGSDDTFIPGLTNSTGKGD